MDVRLQMGSTMVVSGPTSSGKTVFVMKLLEAKREVFDIPPTQVYWFYGHKTAMHDVLIKRQYQMIPGIPENFDFIKPNSLVMLDDLMVEGQDSRVITELFIRGAHHVPFFIIATMQNVFHQSKETRSRMLNTHYLALFKNPRDQQQVATLSNQMYPSSKRYLVSAYRDATKGNPHSYLFIDMRQATPDILRVRTRILPSEGPMVAYIDKQSFGDLAISQFRNEGQQVQYS